MRTYTLDATDLHRITYHEVNPEDPRVVITFAHVDGGMGASGFGTDFCLKNGWNTIYVGKQKRTFFQSLGGDRFADKVAEIISGKDTCAYGDSAGGYAALYYGGFIRSRILAASPRNRRHPTFGSRRRGEYTHIQDLRDVPSSPFRPTVFYDPDNGPDHRMVARWVLPAYPEANLIHVVNSGHRAIKRLKDAGALSTMVKRFVDGDALEGFTYSFPTESLDHDLDAGRRAYRDKNYREAIRYLSPNLEHLDRFSLVEPLSRSVVKLGDRHTARALASHADGVVVSSLPSRLRDKLLLLSRRS